MKKSTLAFTALFMIGLISAPFSLNACSDCTKKSFSIDKENSATEQETSETEEKAAV